MSVNINADTTNGLVITSDNSGEVKLQSAGADIATISSTGLAVAAGKTITGDGSSLTGISSYADSDALSLFNASGSAPVYACRAWVKFNGTTATINGSGNVSSLTDGGVGRYIVNFTTAMPDALYTVALGVADDGTSGNMVTNGNSVYTPNFTTSSFRVQTMNFSATQQDKDHIHAVVFR